MEWLSGRDGGGHFGLTGSRTTFLHGRGAVALAQRSDRHGSNELLGTMLVKLDFDPLFGVGFDGTETEFGMLNLRALRVIRLILVICS